MVQTICICNNLNNADQFETIVNFLILSYGVGQLSGMWWRRSIIGVLGGPVLFIVMILPLMSILRDPSTFVWPIRWIAIWSLAVTWLMMRRWLEDRRDWRFHAVLASALFIVYLPSLGIVFGKIISSIPTALTNAQQQEIMMPMSPREMHSGDRQ